MLVERLSQLKEQRQALLQRYLEEPARRREIVLEIIALEEIIAGEEEKAS